MTICDLKPGQSAVVEKLVCPTGSSALKRRISDMGITKGTTVSVTKVAPLGDPIELTIRGYQLSVRKDEAVLVQVSPLSHPPDSA
jgi:ferrous iron transport protein A